MAHITIKNIGPIKEVSFDLNKINVFMGPQSSGKSTIAKIVSYCSWLEKEMVLHANVSILAEKHNLFGDLISFHNLEENYFNNDSEIIYKSDVCEISLFCDENKKSDINIMLGNSRYFKNRKIAYIPAERNFVTLPGLGKYTDSKGNLMSFMYDWFLAKNEINTDRKFIIPIQEEDEFAFYYDKSQDKDTIILKNGETIQLPHASSGLRSCIPMLVVFIYIMETIYQNKRTKSPFEIVGIQDKVEMLPNKQRIEFGEAYKKFVSFAEEWERLISEKHISVIELDNKRIPVDEFKESMYKVQEQMANALGLFSDYHFSQIIIEEPELNLFPKSQQELVYFILSQFAKSSRPHQLVLTTHSPFVLFAINNCMMGGLVGDKIPDDEKSRIASASGWINPSEVSIFEIHDGTIKSIQDEDGIIEDNYLNQAYKENSNEYLSMLNYYDDEE